MNVEPPRKGGWLTVFRHMFLAMMTFVGACVAAAAQERPATARPALLDQAPQHGKIVEIPPGTTTPVNVQLDAGNYEVSVFAQLKGTRLADHSTDLVNQTAAPPVIQRLLIEQGVRSVKHFVDLKKSGLDGCCADNFDEIQIRYRNINPLKPSSLSVTAIYDKPIAVSPSSTADDFMARTIAVSGEAGPPELGTKLLDTNESHWAARPLSYVARRAFGIGTPGSVFVTAIPEGSVAQLTPELDLSSASQVVFVMAGCAKPLNMNIRFRSSQGTMLMRRMLDRALVTPYGEDKLVSLNLEFVRHELGLAPSDRMLELFEFIGLFGSGPQEAISCRPVRAIRAVVGGALSGGPLAQVRFPATVEESPGGFRVMRIQQAAMRDEANWGHMLRRLEISAIGRTENDEVAGIDLLSVDLVTPDARSTHLSAATSDGCRTEVGSLLRLPPEELRDLAVFCPIAAKLIPMGGLVPPRDRSPAAIEGIRFVPVGLAEVAVGRLAGAVGGDVAFRRDTDQLEVVFEAMGTAKTRRTFELRLKTAEDLLISAPGGRPGPDGSTVLLDTMPGDLPTLALRRSPRVTEMQSHHRFEVIRLRELRSPESGGQAAADAVSETFRAVDWSSPIWNGHSGSQAETCRQMQGVGVCSLGAHPLLSRSGDALTISNGDLKQHRLILPVPFQLPGRSVFQLDAEGRKEDGEPAQAAVHTVLLIETLSGKVLRHAFVPNELVALFPTDELVTRAELVLAAPRAVAAIAVVRASFVSFQPASDTSTASRIIRRTELSVMRPSGFSGAQGAVRSEVNGDTVVINAAAAAIIPETVAEWRHRLGFRRADIVSLNLKASWTAQRQCQSMEVEITVGSGVNRRTIERPLCQQSLNVSASEALPVQAGLDDLIDTIDVRIRRRLSFVPVAVTATIDLSIATDRPLSQLESVASGPVLTIGGRPHRFSATAEGRLEGVTELGVWLPAGFAVSRGDQPLPIETLPHPSVNIRAVRFAPALQR